MPRQETENICYAESTPTRALTWTTLAFFGGFAGVSAFGPILARLRETMEISPLLMGLLASSPALTGSLLRIPFGAMVDRMGGKKPVLILLGLAFAGIAGITLMFGLSEAPTVTEYPLFLLFGILCGCGIAVFSVGIPAVSYWYPQKKQGTALALYAGLGNLAPGMFALLLPFLVELLGFRVSYVLWSGLLLALFGLILAFMKDAPYFQYQKLGITLDKEALLLSCGQELFPSGKALDSLKQAASNWRTWVLTYFYFITFGGFIALTVWFPTYWAALFGKSLVLAGGLTALYSLSSSLLRVAGGRLSDRLGGERVVFLSFLVTGLGAVVLTFTTASMPSALVGEMLMALGMGFANAAIFKLVPQYTPTAVGGAAGIVGGLGAFGGFAIPPLMGLFIEISGPIGYSRGFSVFLGLSVIAVFLFAVLSRHRPAETDQGG